MAVFPVSIAQGKNIDFFMPAGSALDHLLTVDLEPARHGCLMNFTLIDLQAQRFFLSRQEAFPDLFPCLTVFVRIAKRIIR